MVLEPNELVHDTFVSIYTSIMPMALIYSHFADFRTPTFIEDKI